MEKLSKAGEPRETTSILNNLSKDYPLFAEAIKKIHNEEPLGELFRK